VGDYQLVASCYRREGLCCDFDILALIFCCHRLTAAQQCVATECHYDSHESVAAGCVDINARLVGEVWSASACWSILTLVWAVGSASRARTDRLNTLAHKALKTAQDLVCAIP
jgi:hypothetical protein